MASNKIWTKATSTNSTQTGTLKQNGELLINDKNDNNVFKLNKNEFSMGVTANDGTKFSLKGDRDNIFIGKTTESGEDIGFAIEDGKVVIKGTTPLILGADAVENNDAVTLHQLQDYFESVDRGKTEYQYVDDNIQVRCMTDDAIQSFFDSYFSTHNISGSRNAIFGTAIPLFVDGQNTTATVNTPWREQIMPSQLAETITGEYGFIRKLGDNEGLIGYFRRVGVDYGDMVTVRTDPYLNFPLFQDFYCNYIYDINGNRRITAIQEMNDGKYKETGDVDVGILSPAFWVKIEDVVVPLSSDNEDDETLEKLYPDFANLSQYCSTYDEVVGIKERRFWMCYELPESEQNNGWHYWSAGVRHDGEKAPYVVHTPYLSGRVNDASSGKLRSQPGLKAVVNMSYNNLYNTYSFSTNAGFKGKGYHGGTMELWSWAVLNMIIKYGCKSSQQLSNGIIGNSIWYTQNQASDENNCLIVAKSPTYGSDYGYYPIAGNYVTIAKGLTGNSGSLQNSNLGVLIDNKRMSNVLITNVVEDGDNLKYYFNLPIDYLFDYDSSSAYSISFAFPTSGNTRIVGKADLNGEEIYKFDGCVGHANSCFSPWRLRLCEFGQGLWDTLSDIVCIGDGTYGYVYCAPKGERKLDVADIKNTYINVGMKSNRSNYPLEFDFLFTNGDVPSDSGKYYDACFFPHFTTDTYSGGENYSWGDYYWEAHANNSGYEFISGGYVSRGANCGLCCLNSNNARGIASWDLAARD